MKIAAAILASLVLTGALVFSSSKAISRGRELHSMHTELKKLSGKVSRANLGVVPKPKIAVKTTIISALSGIAMPFIVLQFPGVLPIVREVCNAIAGG